MYPENMDGGNRLKPLVTSLKWFIYSEEIFILFTIGNLGNLGKEEKSQDDWNEGMADIGTGCRFLKGG